MMTVQARVGASDMLEEAARWAKRNAKALKLARYALCHGVQPSVITLVLNSDRISFIFVLFPLLEPHTGPPSSALNTGQLRVFQQ